MTRSRIAFETPWFSVEELAANEPPNPFPGPYFRIRAPDDVITLVLSADDELVMVRQFRPAIETMTIESPAGSIDGGETPREAAAREIFEETGFRCEHLVLLGRSRLSLNRFCNSVYFFLGLGGRAEPGWQPEAGVERLLIPRRAFRELLRADDFEQAALLVAVALADARLGCRLLYDRLEDIVRAVAEPDTGATAPPPHRSAPPSLA